MIAEIVQVVASELPLDPPDDDRLGRLYRHWLGLKGARALPDRARIRPEELGFMLGHLALIDVSPSPREYRFRLVGTAITARRGADLTGQTTAALRPARYRATIDSHFDAACEQRRAVLYHVVLGLDSIKRSFRHIVLPFTSDGGAVDRLMAGVWADNRIEDVLQSPAFLES